jgi:hypothetical protein
MPKPQIPERIFKPKPQIPRKISLLGYPDRLVCVPIRNGWFYNAVLNSSIVFKYISSAA